MRRFVRKIFQDRQIEDDKQNTSANRLTAWRPMHDRQIRLVQLSRGKAGNVCIRLNVVGIDEAPPYYAVSYTWGEQPFDHKLACADGDMAHVTRSCFEVLHCLLERGLDTVWIDQLSINQHDYDERTQQILLMNEIYSGAKSVHVWLGVSKHHLQEIDLFQPAEVRPGLQLEDYQECVHLISTIADSYSSWLTRTEKASRQNNASMTSIIPVPVTASHKAWCAFANVFDSVYFQRRWIIQEIILNRNVFAYVDDFAVPWTEIGLCCEAIGKFRQGIFPDIGFPDSHPVRTRSTAFGQGIRHVILIEKIRQQVQTGGIDLLELLQNASLFNNSYQIDAIYALLSIAKDRLRYPPPTYNCLDEQAFISYSSMMVESGYGGSLIKTAGLGRRPPKDNPLYIDVPSWCPDWTMTARFFPPLHPVTKTPTPSNFMSLKVHKNRLALRTTCHLVDRVVHVSQVYNNTLEGDRELRNFINQFGTNEPQPTATADAFRAISASMRQSPGSEEWKTILAEHVSRHGARAVYIDSLRLPSSLFDPSDEMGNDVWLELVFGYNIRFTLGDRTNVLCITKDGFVGVVPLRTKPGDFIAHIYGVDDRYMVLTPNLKLRCSQLVGDCEVKSWGDPSQFEAPAFDASAMEMLLV